MSTIPKFKLSIQEDTLSPIDVAVWNNFTGDFASQKLRSMKPIIKEFNSNLCSKEDVMFSHMTQSQVDKLKEMLPKHRLSI